MYAHNGSGFDCYLILQESGLQFESIVMKGGIMCL